jgi:excinuclease ABC subunit A
VGPEGGHRGGQILATGTPEDIALIPESHTGRFLRDLLPTPSTPLPLPTVEEIPAKKTRRKRA